MARFRVGVWDYRLRCEPGCRTHAEPRLAHRIANEAAQRAELAAGLRLVYTAVADSHGVAGVVRAGAT